MTLKQFKQNQRKDKDTNSYTCFDGIVSNLIGMLPHSTHNIKAHHLEPELQNQGSQLAALTSEERESLNSNYNRIRHQTDIYKIFTALPLSHDSV